MVLVLVAGVWAAVTVSYRVATFPTCPAAAEELQGDIRAARAALKEKGFRDPGQ